MWQQERQVWTTNLKESYSCQLQSSVLSVCLLVGSWGFCMFIPVWGLGCVRHQYCGDCPYCLWFEQQCCTRYLFEVEFGAFFQSKNCLPFLADCQGCYLWYLVTWSRICMCFSCTDVLKLKCSHFIGYLHSHMCWTLFMFEVSLNASAKKKK